jgi:integral membrane sensor domain MASE1
VYFASAEAGLRIALVGQQVTPIWPPTGVALGSLLLLGLRIWPGIALGAFATNILIGPTLPAVLMIAVGNTVAPVAAYLLLKRMGFHNQLDRLYDVLALVFIGALAGTLISATVGSATLAIAARPASAFWTTWSVWWTGDAMGVLLVAPLILVASTVRISRTPNLLRVVEAAALLGGTALAAVLSVISSVPLLFLVFPFLLWAALRFQLAGAIPCALIASVVTTFAASRGFPAFAGLDLTTKMIELQAFNGSVTLTALVHATITAQRDRARREIEGACAELAEAVVILGQASPLGGGVTDLVSRLEAKKNQLR